MTQPMPQLEGVEHKYVNAGDIRVHVAESVPTHPSGDPLVLLHGWPQNWFMWRKLVPLLAPHYRLIMPDLRGHGWTDAPPGPIPKEQLATDLFNTLDALGIERTRIIAHDWGGWTAYLAGLREPERFERLVALNIIAPWARLGRPRMALSFWRLGYQWIAGAPVLGPAAHRQGTFIKTVLTFHDSYAMSDEDLEVFVGQYRDPARANAGSQFYRTFIARETLPLLRGDFADARFQVPTLLLFGDTDLVQPPWWREGLADNGDDFTLENVPDVGHFIAEAKPELVAQRALEFFGTPR